ncbi:hypothetical protein KCP70_05900 [Salmonella enterica subsp. enterica]|nr:hypothetical protein KCP70_05900 [Salmonella enterica subsp. enterica]
MLQNEPIPIERYCLDELALLHSAVNPAVGTTAQTSTKWLPMLNPRWFIMKPPCRCRAFEARPAPDDVKRFARFGHVCCARVLTMLPGRHWRSSISAKVDRYALVWRLSPLRDHIHR